MLVDGLVRSNGSAADVMVAEPMGRLVHANASSVGEQTAVAMLVTSDLRQRISSGACQ